jgi:hypothetical protein
MTDPRIPRDIDDLERNAAGALDAIRTAARLMRAIAPIAAELVGTARGCDRAAVGGTALPAGAPR